MSDSIQGGVKLDTLDSRDYIKEIKSGVDENISINLLDGIDVHVRNQGNFGSCTGFASTNLMSILGSRLVGSWVDYNPYYNWYKGRLFEGTENENCGVQPRTIIRTLKENGVLPEFKSSLTPFSPPDESDDLNASRMKIKSYFKIPEDNKSNGILYSLLKEKIPVLVTIKLFDKSWRSCNFSGELNLPEDSDISNVYHMVCAYGWDAKDKKFLMLNSHGPNFGKSGSFKVGKEYIDLYSINNWTVGYNYF